MKNKIGSKLQNIAIKQHLPLYGSVFFTVTSITVVNISPNVMVNVERRNQSSYHQFLLSDVQLHLYGGTTLTASEFALKPRPQHNYVRFIISIHSISFVFELNIDD